MAFIHKNHAVESKLPPSMGHQFGVDLCCTHAPCESHWWAHRAAPEPCWLKHRYDDAPSVMKITPTRVVDEMVAMRMDGMSYEAIAKATGVPRSRVGAVLEFKGAK